MTETARPRLAVLRAAWLFDGISSTSRPDPVGNLACWTDAEVIAAMKHAGQQALRAGVDHGP